MAEIVDIISTKDISLIPTGNYCYRKTRIEEIDEKGRIRDYYLTDTNDRCPYWHRTSYGTVRCNFLSKEVIDDEVGNARQKIIQHFGNEAAVEKFGYSWELSDEIKICGINRDDEDD